MPDEEAYKQKVNILDGLTEHRSDRAQILLKNLKNEDLVHIDPDKIPAFLRIDKDIKTKQEALALNHASYMQFNIDELRNEISSTLDSEIKVVSRDFDTHNQSVDQQLG